MAIRPFKKPVPEDRTVVDGIWLDILDDWSASFETNGSGAVGVSVYVQDQTSPVLNVPFLIERSTATLAADTVVNSRTVTLTAGHSAVAGQILELADPAVTSGFMQARILSVNVNTITVDQPVNRVYTASTGIVVVSSDDMLVDGSVTPQVFSVLPLPTQKGDMVRAIWEIHSTSDMDFSTFGGKSSLTNGCVLRVNNGDGTYKNLFNFKNNGDIIRQTFDHEILLPKQGNTINGFSARITWGGQDKHGSVIRLDGAQGQALELVVQDDLTTGNVVFNMTCQGHELQGN